jgi:hypothetical protein
MIGSRKQPQRFTHPLIPPLIELECRCGELIRCEHPVNKKGYSDTPEGWSRRTRIDRSFTAKCNRCGFSKNNLSYFDCIELGPLYYTASVGYEYIWGWNHEHLSAVVDFLEGRLSRENRWYWYMSFVPGKWKTRSRRHAFIKAAKKVLPDFGCTTKNFGFCQK